MTDWMTPGVNAYLIGVILATIVALVPLAIAWLNMQKKKFNEIAEATKAMMEANREILLQNTQIAKNIERQTYGINKKMIKIAEAVAFIKGRIKERREDPNRPVEN